jgi:hypothetical protein
VEEAIDQLKIIRLKQERSRSESENIVLMIEELMAGSNSPRFGMNQQRKSMKISSLLDVINEEENVEG